MNYLFAFWSSWERQLWIKLLQAVKQLFYPCLVCYASPWDMKSQQLVSCLPFLQNRRIYISVSFTSYFSCKHTFFVTWEIIEHEMHFTSMLDSQLNLMFVHSLKFWKIFQFLCGAMFYSSNGSTKLKGKSLVV